MKSSQRVLVAIVRAGRRRAGALVAACAVVGLLATGCATLEEKEREWTFRVVKEDAGWYGGVPAGVQEMDLPVSGEPGAQRIHAWWWPAAHPDAPVVYYLHGVRWNLTGHVRRIQQLRDFGFSVFAIDYRGFGKSDGALPSEAMTYEDAATGWAWVARQQPDPARRLIYGHSLGGAVAIDLAARLEREHPGSPQARGLIVESTFTSLPDIAAELSWSWLPTKLFMSMRYDSIDKVRAVGIPVLFAHGTGDRYVPARFSQALYDACVSPKRLLLIENGSHNNSLWVGSGDYEAALTDFFRLDLARPGT